MSDFIKQNAIKNTFKVGDSWAILSEIEHSIKAKIEKIGIPLKNWNIKISRGILTGCNEAYIIDEEKRRSILDACASEDERQRTDKIIRPILRGRDINRDGYKWAGLYCILAYFDFHKEISLYPSIHEYLKQYESKLRNRGQVRYTSSGKPKNGADYPGQHHWLELDNNPRKEYMDDFSKQKIIWSDISTEPNFLFNDEEIYFNNTCYMIIGAPEWVINYLNSDIIRWDFPKVIASDLGAGTRYFKQFVEMIPVPKEYNSETFYLDIGLSDEEIKFISSSVNS